LDFKLQQIVQGYGSEKRVQEVYGKSLSQIKRDYRDDVRKAVLGRRWVQQRIAEQPRATRQDVENFFKQYADTLATQKVPLQYDCAVIAVAVKPNASARDSARLLGLRIIDSLQKGSSFADLARRNSKDPSSAANAGDLGFQKRGIFVKEFDQAAFSLKEGQTSGLVETQFGFHIINVVERRGEEVRARHILITVPKTTDDEKAAFDSLQHVRSRLLTGTSFDSTARAISEDAETKPFGGEAGPLPAAAFTTSISDVLKGLKPGEISPPLKSTLASGDAAFKIFLLKRIIPEHAPTLETDYKQLERITVQFMQQKEYESLIQDVRKQVYWTIVQ
jgi:peptidyl-prolyl cis-trans isomerase SurA